MISWLEKNKWVSWTVTIIIFVVIFYMSSITIEPGLVGPKSPLATIYHFSAFFFLALFLYISAVNRELDWTKVVLVIGIVVAYAGLDELHQYLVPGRYCSFSDFLIDTTGVVFASVIYLILIFKKRL